MLREKLQWWFFVSKTPTLTSKLHTVPIHNSSFCPNLCIHHIFPKIHNLFLFPTLISPSLQNPNPKTLINLFFKFIIYSLIYRISTPTHKNSNQKLNLFHLGTTKSSILQSLFFHLIHFQYAHKN